MFSPDKEICHNCMVVVQDGRRYCSRCYRRMMALRMNPLLPRHAATPFRAHNARDTLKERRRRARLCLCGTCGMPALDGRKACLEHAKIKRASRSARTFHALVAQGLCRCKAPLAPGKKRCRRCLRKLRRENRARYARYKAEGRCQYCPKKRVRGSTWCRVHRARVLAQQPKHTAAFIARRVAAKRCVTCNRRTTGTQNCKRCSREGWETRKGRAV
jgi:hypothetical protein